MRRCSMSIELSLVVLYHLSSHLFHKLIRCCPLLRKTTVRLLERSALAWGFYGLFQSLGRVQSILSFGWRSWTIFIHLIYHWLSYKLWFGRHAVLDCWRAHRWHTTLPKLFPFLHLIWFGGVSICLWIWWMVLFASNLRVPSSHLCFHSPHLILLITALLKL